LGQKSPGGIFGCLHDLSLHTLRKAGGAHNAPGRGRNNEGLQSLAPQLLLLYMRIDRPGMRVMDAKQGIWNQAGGQ